MAQRTDWPLGNDVTVHTVFSDIDDGDLAIGCDPGRLDERRAALAPLPWTWLEQVHGPDVVVVGRAGQHAGARADASVTDRSGATLSVQVADCAAVLLFAPRVDGAVIGAAHAGWKGLRSGVLTAVVGQMRDLGGTDIDWVCGPCISPAAYEFSQRDLDALESELGAPVSATTASGRPALDVRTAVEVCMRNAGVEAAPLASSDTCTAASPAHWSHRGGGDTGRQAGAIWWSGPGGGS